MKKYFVVVEGDTAVKVFEDRDEADAYAEDRQERNIEDSKEEYDYEDEAAAAYQNGYDGGDVEVVPVDLDAIPEDEEEYTVSAESGDITLSVSEIYDLIDKD